MAGVDQVCSVEPCWATLQEAIDLGRHPVIEVLGGVHPGPIVVDRDVTIRGVAGPLLLGGPGISAVVTVKTTGLVAFEDLAIEGAGLSAGVVVEQAGTVVLDGVLLAGGAGAGGSCLAVKAAAEAWLVDGTVERCTGPDGAVRVAADRLWVKGSRLTASDTPTLVADRATEVRIEDTVVDENGWSLVGANGPAVHLVEVDTVAILRAWLCLNLDGGRAALEVEGGCQGACTVEHSVIQLNGGGGLEWSGAGGLVTHTTLVGNVSGTNGAQARVSGGALAIERSVVVDDGPIGGRTALTRTPSASATVTDVAISANEPGVPLGVDGIVPFEPAFVLGYVPPACGLPVVFDPHVEDEAGVLVWPGETGKGALTTEDCGPWCADADGDGSPAMWDCAEDDPRRRHDVIEIVDDGIDQDCDGADGCWLDADADGYGGRIVPVPSGDCAPPYFAPVGGDCDDGDWTISPATIERPGDGTDGDCDGAERCWLDLDGDGWTGAALGNSPDLACAAPPYGTSDEGDCADDDPAIHPGADDVPHDGIDQDCLAGDTKAWVTGGACGCAADRPAGIAALVPMLLALLHRRTRARAR